MKRKNDWNVRGFKECSRLYSSKRISRKILEGLTISIKEYRTLLPYYFLLLAYLRKLSQKEKVVVPCMVKQPITQQPCTWVADGDSRLKAWCTGSCIWETSMSAEDRTSGLPSHAQMPSKEADYIVAISVLLAILDLRAVQHWKLLVCDYVHCTF